MAENQKVRLFVIGAMKAGTTSVYELLKSSSNASLPSKKETNQFISSVHSRRSIEEYHSLFQGSGPKVDVSPNHSKRDTFQGVAERIYHYNPEAKLVYLTRDPLSRLLSEIQHAGYEGMLDSNTRYHWWHYQTSRNFKKRHGFSLQTAPKLGDFADAEPIQNSRYGYQISAFLEAGFAKSQISIIPPLEKQELIAGHFSEFLSQAGIHLTSKTLPLTHRGGKRYRYSEIMMRGKERGGIWSPNNWLHRFPKTSIVMDALNLRRPLSTAVLTADFEY